MQFLGSRTDVDKILDEVDIFAFSTTKDEGFGIAIAEAMGKGLPIVASDVGACREILANGKFGILVKPCSDTAIANAIRNILKNQKNINRIRKKANEYALENFTKQKMAKSYLLELGLLE